MFDDHFKKYVIPVGKIVPVVSAYFGDGAIAQTTQQPQPITYAAPNPDPISSWGILGSLVLSGGAIIFTAAKGFLGNLSKRSEIELKAQELQNQRSENIATTLMAQQASLVEGMIAQQKEDRKQYLAQQTQDRQQLIDLITGTNQKLGALASAVEDLKKAVEGLKKQ